MTKQDENWLLNFKNATILSATFCFIYIPANVTQNTMSQILSKNFGELGFTLQALLYLCSMTGSLISPALIKKYGMKPLFIIGGILFDLVIFEQILPAWY